MDRVSSFDNAPSWLPRGARWYLAHIEQGLSMRMLAQQAGCHASTVQRAVRRIEARRDDPLIDSALDRLAGRSPSRFLSPLMECSAMTATIRKPRASADETTIAREARRILRRMSEPGSLLAVAHDLEKAAVLREGSHGQTTRIAVLERAVAEAFAVKDWIAVHSRGSRVTTYVITPTGRAALGRLLTQEQTRRRAEEGASPERQHGEWMGPQENGEGRIRGLRAESPLAILARRRGPDGAPFLGSDLVAAGERLREDFEIAQMGPRVTQNWERFLTGAERGGFSGRGPAEGPAAARERVLAALRELGPGLGDVALRCCCFLEGMEQAEKRLGWSARSGKIVLKIALQRLRQHYARQGGGGLIG
ncbi:DUF6456 domain-containing protein [Rhodovulum bhavnagarense]|nr:DUF6456 domain-containing protein [Rhodovulum bhavnagarense]